MLLEKKKKKKEINMCFSGSWKYVRINLYGMTAIKWIKCLLMNWSVGVSGFFKI